ncbi:MAG: SoxR reducing system RseC family protein [Candidatus Oleimicrobiaceae bacterium]
MEADNTAQARVGDWVEVGLPSRSRRWAIGAVYGSLLAALWLGLAIGCFVSRHFSADEKLTLTIASGLGVVLGVVVLRLLDRCYRPSYRVVGILGHGPLAPRERWQAKCRLSRAGQWGDRVEVLGLCGRESALQRP